MRAADEKLSFNRGVISPRALSRIDLKRLQMAASEQTNWMPRAMGSMMLRPGLQHLGLVPEYTRFLPFIFSSTDTALIRFGANRMRIWKNEAVLSRPAVVTAVTNGGFSSSVSNWADEDEAGAYSGWDAATQSMVLTGTGSKFASRRQLLTVAVAEANTVHALRIQILRGNLTLRVGTSSATNNLVADITLKPGVHSIAFTPVATTLHVSLRNQSTTPCLVASCVIDEAGPLTFATPYAEEDLGLIRYRQSGDVIFLACEGYPQMQIERRDGDSWSLVDYAPQDGPFRVENTSGTTITPSAQTGDITLTASAPVFRLPLYENGVQTSAMHTGSLWSVSTNGQRQDRTITGADQWTDSIKVTGSLDDRKFNFTAEITGTARVTLQRSIGAEGGWTDLNSWTATLSGTRDHTDVYDGQDVYFRIGVKAGDFTSGTAVVSLDYRSGRKAGIVRITSVVSQTQATATVLSAMGNTQPTSVWAEGLWNDYRGWPTAVEIHDGRLWWAGKDRFVASVSDNFTSFDKDFEGDAGPILRSIGFGPVDTINWMESVGPLTAGTDGMELQCRSSALDEPLTPSNFYPKKVGGQGSAKIAAVNVDGKALFVARSGRRVYELSWSVESRDYIARDLTQLCPDYLSPIVRMAVQRQPDTRIHCVMADGEVAVLVYDKAENLECWMRVQTDGFVEDVVVLPGESEDSVYYVVRRSVNGEDQRSLEKWAREDQCEGGQDNRCLDSHVVAYNTSFINVPHLVGREVVIWADGREIMRRTVKAAGSLAIPINLGQNYAVVVAGIPYEARFRSTKLAYVGDQGSSTLGSRKKIDSIAIGLYRSNLGAIRYGQDFDHLEALPLVVQGAERTPNDYIEQHDFDATGMHGTWDTDKRLCLLARSPYACTVTHAVVHMTGNGK